MSEVNKQQVIELRKSIEAFLIRFDQLGEKYGILESFKALKRQYKDVCCNGDVIINDIIKGLDAKYGNDESYYPNFLLEHQEDAEEVKRLIDEYVMDTLERLDEAKLDLEVFF